MKFSGLWRNMNWAGKLFVAFGVVELIFLFSGIFNETLLIIGFGLVAFGSIPHVLLIGAIDYQLPEEPKPEYYREQCDVQEFKRRMGF